MLCQLELTQTVKTCSKLQQKHCKGNIYESTSIEEPPRIKKNSLSKNIIAESIHLEKL